MGEAGRSAWVYCASIVTTYMDARFILPTIPLACILGGVVLAWALAGRRPARWDLSGECIGQMQNGPDGRSGPLQSG
jgi:hypothetical protein